MNQLPDSTWLLSALVGAVSLFIAGCGNAPGSVLGSTATGLTPGLYTGTVTCDTIATFDGAFGQATGLGTRSITIGSNGLPLFAGVPVVVGQVETGSFEQMTWTDRITSVTPSANGVIVEHSGEASVECGDTCTYAFDGECDETAYCDWGTDCTDCGPLRATGVTTFTYRMTGPASLELTESTFTTAEWIATSGQVCRGTLLR